MDNHIITDELGKEYLYRFLELNKYETDNIVIGFKNEIKKV
ncbi:hypothetical protein [Vallitalea sediminicola]